jgi:hypothetical protein
MMVLLYLVGVDRKRLASTCAISNRVLITESGLRPIESMPCATRKRTNWRIVAMSLTADADLAPVVFDRRNRHFHHCHHNDVAL